MIDIDKVILEWSLRLDNGCPDIKNKRHLGILENVLSDMGLAEA